MRVSSILRILNEGLDLHGAHRVSSSPDALRLSSSRRFISFRNCDELFHFIHDMISLAGPLMSHSRASFHFKASRERHDFKMILSQLIINDDDEFSRASTVLAT
jgi:hypothetical protein